MPTSVLSANCEKTRIFPVAIPDSIQVLTSNFYFQNRYHKDIKKYIEKIIEICGRFLHILFAKRTECVNVNVRLWMSLKLGKEVIQVDMSAL